MHSPIKFESIPTNGIRLHTAVAGPEDGEPVILLHGFPEAWFGWRPQIDALTTAGFRVIAPDQRGYNLSDKPKGVASYFMDTLVADVVGLADSLGFERFCLAGHDFGAMVSWHMGMQYPERLRHLAIANVPHPVVMRSYIRKHPSQVIKSWYTLFFQLPALPERIVRAGNWRMLMSAMPAGLSEEERNRYRGAWEQPGAMTSMINWYRSMLRNPAKLTGSPRISVPTLVVWGKQDPHLSQGMAPLSVDLCDYGNLVTFEDATHWVQHDKPEEVSHLLIEHFRSK
jgi:pimeloyl-ACP methyl ester carboxylesterase